MDPSDWRSLLLLDRCVPTVVWFVEFWPTSTEGVLLHPGLNAVPVGGYLRAALECALSSFATWRLTSTAAWVS